MRRLFALFLLLCMLFQSCWAAADGCAERVADGKPAAQRMTADDAAQPHGQVSDCSCCSCCTVCHGGVAFAVQPPAMPSPRLLALAAMHYRDPLHSNSYLERPERPKWLPAA